MSYKLLLIFCFISLLKCPLLFGADNEIIEGGGGGGGGTSFTCDEIKTTLFVDATNGNNLNDGYSWDKAKKTLHAALYIANRCSKINQVLVAKGVYKASTTASLANRNNAFFIGDGYTLLGGFPTGGGSRDFVNNPTILDGQIADGFEAYHVIVLFSTTGDVIIDGFQIKNGFGDGAGSVNLAEGIAMDQNNGGAIYAKDVPNVTIRNCAIYNNVVTGNGGAIYSANSSISLVNVVVANNTASNGGAMQVIGGSEIRIGYSTFCGNQALNAGGVANSSAGTFLKLTNSIVWGNNLVWNGAGTKEISYSLVQGGNKENNCVAIDPGFNDPNDLNGPDAKWFTNDDGLAVASCSPTVNRGNNNASPAFSEDIASRSRPFNVQTDMGAYELQVIPTVTGVTQRSIGGDAIENYVYSGITSLAATGCRTIALITPNGNSPVNGSVFAVTSIEATDLSYKNQPLVNRHYDIEPKANATEATASISLFFSNGEFSNYNQRADAIAKLPTTDGLNKQDLRIVQYHGLASRTNYPDDYEGTFTIIDPDDANISWSQASLTWKITFDVTGFSGFFVTAVSKYRFSGTGNWNDASKWDNGKVPPAVLPAFCEIIIANGSNCELNVQQSISKTARFIIEPNAQLNVPGKLYIGPPLPL
ncbi:MAG: hypothetical protein V4717_18245 [Bacteroidota bacterium]